MCLNQKEMYGSCCQAMGTPKLTIQIRRNNMNRIKGFLRVFLIIFGSSITLWFALIFFVYRPLIGIWIFFATVTIIYSFLMSILVFWWTKKIKGIWGVIFTSLLASFIVSCLMVVGTLFVILYHFGQTKFLPVLCWIIGGAAGFLYAYDIQKKEVSPSPKTEQ